jgi:hypothetical protein
VGNIDWGVIYLVIDSRMVLAVFAEFRNHAADPVK